MILATTMAITVVAASMINNDAVDIAVVVV